MTRVRVMGPTEIRPDYLWPDTDPGLRRDLPEYYAEDGTFRVPEAHVELFVPETGDPVLSVGYDGAAGAPLAECDSGRVARTIRWAIRRIVLDDRVYEILAGLSPVAARIADGLTLETTPRGTHQRLTPEAEDAREELIRRLDEELADIPELDVRTADEIDRSVIEQLITAETRGEDLPAIAVELRARIARGRAHIVVDDAPGVLRHHRDVAREGVRARLAITARLASGDRRERDELLRRVASWDSGTDTYRALGKMTGLSHTQVRTIVTQATAGRDAALDSMASTIRSLRLAWDPPAVPSGPDPDEYEGWSDWEIEQQEAEDDRAVREHRAMKYCARCGEPAKRIVRRWQVGRSSIQADDDDPHRSEAGYVDDLSRGQQRIHQPKWAVCGTKCARVVIEEDRASTPRELLLPGNTEFYYEVEAWRYVPHDSELPRPLVRLRMDTEGIEQRREQFERDLYNRDLAGAALDLAHLRRYIARAAANLAAIETWTPAPRTFEPGTPEPDELIQVRHGDIIYGNMKIFAFDDRADYWEGPGGERRTWDELTEMGVTEIAREKIRIPHDGDADEDDFQPSSGELFWHDSNDRTRPRPQLDDAAGDYDD